MNGDTFVEVEGARLRVREAGSGPAVVLLHGWALDLDMWALQFPELSQYARVIAFDRRGFGLSPGLPSVEQDVKDLEGVMDALQVDRAMLVGMSQGSRVALRFALANPERTEALVLDGGPAEHAELMDTDWEQDISDYLDLVHERGSDAFREAWSCHPFMRLYNATPAAEATLEKVLGRCPVSALDGPHVPSAFLGDRLGEIRQPTLVLVGALDSPRRQAVAEALAEGLPDATLRRVLGAGHLAALDSTSIYNQLVVDFLLQRR